MDTAALATANSITANMYAQLLPNCTSTDAHLFADQDIRLAVVINQLSTRLIIPRLRRDWQGNFTACGSHCGLNGGPEAKSMAFSVGIWYD